MCAKLLILTIIHCALLAEHNLAIANHDYDIWRDWSW